MSSLDPTQKKLLIAGAALAGVATLAVVAYTVSQNKCGSSKTAAIAADSGAVNKNKVDAELTIDQVHLDYMDKMAKAHKLDDLDKVARVMLEFALKDADEHNVFSNVRCATCGNKSKQKRSWKIHQDQLIYLQDMATKYKLSDGPSKAFRILCDYAIADGDETVIFQTVRCRRC